ncbi:hypothetical protein F5888DRAFT_1634238 [Russula emetica]|nr:hypothetical protein F5888DRAFT_1634238 [Russula emetica]
MSRTHPTSASSSNFQLTLIFDNALKAYQKRTKKDLLTHPLAAHHHWNDGWCGFAGPGNTSSVRNLDVDKAWAVDSLTGAVIIMVIIVVERMKRSRREELDGGGVHAPLPWQYGRHRKVVAAKAEPGPKGAAPFPAQLEQRFNKHFHLQHSNAIPSVGPLC